MSSNFLVVGHFKLTHYQLLDVLGGRQVIEYQRERCANGGRSLHSSHCEGALRREGRVAARGPLLVAVAMVSSFSVVQNGAQYSTHVLMRNPDSAGARCLTVSGALDSSEHACYSSGMTLQAAAKRVAVTPDTSGPPAGRASLSPMIGQ